MPGDDRVQTSGRLRSDHATRKEPNAAIDRGPDLRETRVADHSLEVGDWVQFRVWVAACPGGANRYFENEIPRPSSKHFSALVGPWESGSSLTASSTPSSALAAPAYNSR